MSLLDELIPLPRLLELDQVELAASPGLVWETIRHGDLGRSPLIRALFAIRTLPSRIAGKIERAALRLDDLRSTPERPGFQILLESPGREVTAGAIGPVWQLDIPFVHVAGPTEFARFDPRGVIKVAWAIRVLPFGDRSSRVEIEVRADARDEESWQKFRRYFRLIGPGSHLIRRSLLASLARELGAPGDEENHRPLDGDELLSAARVQVTHAVTIEARPEEIWPWLVQMGCRRGGFYSYDSLDNGGMRSAREVHPELQQLQPGEIIPATPLGPGGFEVLRIDAPRALILGGLYDFEVDKQFPFSARRPDNFWHATWAFVLEPLDDRSTRLHARARVAFSRGQRLRLAWIAPVHHFMQTAQLAHLKRRVEGKLARDDWRDVLEGAGGAARMLLHLLTPFVRNARSRWGIDEAGARATYPGDALIPEPRWGWTHAVEIAAGVDAVWPWIAQIGADRGGFYSYQWLENIAGCKVKNAERIHPEWELELGAKVSLHPDAPPLRVEAIERGRWFVLHAPAKLDSGPWITVTWTFFLEPIAEDRCRLISRYRSACSGDFVTRLEAGPLLLEPVGFAMDRRMLLGIKERCERPYAGTAWVRSPITSTSSPQSSP